MYDKSYFNSKGLGYLLPQKKKKAILLTRI